MKIVEKPEALTALRRGRVALVPTMGALHEGHLSLVRRARAAAETVFVSVFVNPRQFDRADDLDAYPRDLDGDAAKLAEEGVHALYAPAPETVYPPGFASTVFVDGLSARWEGECRPGHFDGVATVVARLFGQCAPDCAVFGEKDWQQLAIIRRMTTDLALPVEILAGPTVREADGLAMASRNLRLDTERRARAPRLHARMQAVAAGDETPDAAIAALHAEGFGPVDYLALVDAETLEPCAREQAGRLLAAAWLGDVRLIDNLAVI